jgi:hypothetical protein
LGLAQSKQFQDAFEALWIAKGAPEDVALLENHDASQAGVSSALVIAASDTSIFETISPGGWEAVDPSMVNYWIGLVCQAGTADCLGIKFGAH